MKKVLRFANYLMGSIIGSKQHNFPNNVHIHEAMNWLIRAQESTADYGVSEGFHLYHGWLSSYPETTGYIIETFFDYANKTGETVYRDHALRMADWLCSIQNEDGAISDTSFSKRMVFDTGQVIFGLVRSYKETGESKYRYAAIKCGDWLANEQEPDGSWVKHAAHNIPHTYYSRVAWSLLSLYSIHTCDDYLNSCKKNIAWCLSQQEPNGWFREASFNLKNHHQPFTHTIAYTIRGIVEAGIFLKDEIYINASIKAIDNLSAGILNNGFVPGTYNMDWKGNYKFSCLTGSAQLAIIFFKLARLKKIEKYFELGVRINNYLKSGQNLLKSNKDTRGAIAGSKPFWGKYLHFIYPNWAAKFFVDSLLLEENIREKNEFF